MSVAPVCLRILRIGAEPDCSGRVPPAPAVIFGGYLLAGGHNFAFFALSVSGA